MVFNTTPGSMRRHRASDSDVSEFDSNVNNLRIAFQKIKKIFISNHFFTSTGITTVGDIFVFNVSNVLL